MKINFKQLQKEEFKACIQELGWESYRADQIIDWMYRKHAVSFDAMSNLPKQLSATLKDIAILSELKLLNTYISMDGAIKFLFQLDDGDTIESVAIPNTRGKNMYTLCISSQAGCAMGCTFCETGKLGLIRNLKAYEIIDQVLAVQRYLKQSSSDMLTDSVKRNFRIGKGDISNIVFMGMGEPFSNMNEVLTSLFILTDLIGISKRKITVSTSGIVPGIEKLSEKGPAVNLAISLNATTDSTRTRLMPINKTYPIKKLLQACRAYPLPPKRRITIEYVLLKDINDSRDDAHRLVKLLRGIRSKINLIPFNHSESYPEFVRPDERRVQDFQNILVNAGVIATVRKSSGDDISAACGQLRAAYVR
ncbi:MAG: 23S rRNA (adenine(2503)-C(2))-methyltransferase RlmN [Nitrospiraceae bacterium]|nr:MAG: 23S rRNA (adenine(2503)-C(2))-methyltransferase RlmN [Nitrospiraceae bacterium]